MFIIDHSETRVQCKWQNKVQNTAKQKFGSSSGIEQEFLMGLH